MSDLDEFIDTSGRTVTCGELEHLIKLTLQLCGVQVEKNMQAPVETWNGTVIKAISRVMDIEWFKSVSPEEFRDTVCGSNSHFKIYMVEPRQNANEYIVRYAQW